LKNIFLQESKFQICETSLSGLFLVERRANFDSRGSFEKLFCSEELKPIWGERVIQQNNLSLNTKAGTIRGLHYQVGEYSESKIVSCIKGRIFDVILDLRENSDTFGLWASFELSFENKKSVFIPEGFAHGFQTLEDDVIVNYCHSSSYSKPHERGVNVFDKKLNINWPIDNFSISERDNSLPNFDNSSRVKI